MIEQIANAVLTVIGSWFSGLFSGLSDYAYISEWWLLAAAVLAGCLLVGFFLPWNWARGVLGFIAWTFLVAAWAATQVWLRMRKREPEKRSQKTETNWPPWPF